MPSKGHCLTGLLVKVPKWGKREGTEDLPVSQASRVVGGTSPKELA